MDEEWGEEMEQILTMLFACRTLHRSCRGGVWRIKCLVASATLGEVTVICKCDGPRKPATTNEEDVRESTVK